MNPAVAAGADAADPAEARVHYEAQFELPAGFCSGSASVCPDSGTVEWASAPDGAAQAPDWLRDYATATLRAAFRNRHNVGWPRRLTRWRKEPANPS